MVRATQAELHLGLGTIKKNDAITLLADAGEAEEAVREDVAM